MRLIDKYKAWAKYPEKYTAKEVLNQIVADLENNTDEVKNNAVLPLVSDTVCGYCKSYEKLSPYLYCPFCGKKYEGKTQTGR